MSDQTCLLAWVFAYAQGFQRDGAVSPGASVSSSVGNKRSGTDDSQSGRKLSSCCDSDADQEDVRLQLDKAPVQLDAQDEASVHLAREQLHAADVPLLAAMLSTSRRSCDHTDDSHSQRKRSSSSESGAAQEEIHVEQDVAHAPLAAAVSSTLSRSCDTTYDSQSNRKQSSYSGGDAPQAEVRLQPADDAADLPLAAAVPTTRVRSRNSNSGRNSGTGVMITSDDFSRDEETGGEADDAANARGLITSIVGSSNIVSSSTIVGSSRITGSSSSRNSRKTGSSNRRSNNGKNNCSIMNININSYRGSSTNNDRSERTVDGSTSCVRCDTQGNVHANDKGSAHDHNDGSNDPENCMSGHDSDNTKYKRSRSSSIASSVDSTEAIQSPSCPGSRFAVLAMSQGQPPAPPRRLTYFESIWVAFQ